ncbi:hypothetical protein ACFL3C_00100 [Patescibacteria group bacterium]
MTGNDEKLTIPREFFEEQVKGISNSAKETVAETRSNSSTERALKKAIDVLTDKINKILRRILKAEGVTDKAQHARLCKSIRAELTRDTSLRQLDGHDIKTLIDEGLENAVKELNERFAAILAQLPEGEPADQREAFFEELAACGVEEENAVEGIMEKLNSISLGITPEFFEGLNKFGFDEQLSADQIREFKQLFNTVSGEIRASISGHIQKNPQFSFEVLKKHILETLGQFNFKPQELTRDVVEIFEAVIIRDLRQYIGAAHSIQDLWGLTNDSREETISCEEIQGKLSPKKLAHAQNEDEEKEPYPLSAGEENFILRLYISMDKGFEAQTHQERIEAIATQSNAQNHGGLNIRTAEDVEELLEDIPRHGLEVAEDTKPSPINELMRRVDGAALAPRIIGQALVRLREGLASEAEKSHQLRVPTAIEVNRLNQEIAGIRAEIDEMNDRITQSIEQLTTQYEQIDMISELAILRAQAEKSAPEDQLRNQAEQFEQYLQTIKSLHEELEKIQKLKEAIDQIQSSLQEINDNIDKGDVYIRSTMKTETFGADPRAILGDEYSYIFDYTPDTDLDLKLGSIETASDQCNTKLAELKKIGVGQIFELAEQVATAFAIVKGQLGEEASEELIKVPKLTALKAEPVSLQEAYVESDDDLETVSDLELNSTQIHALLFTTAMGQPNRVYGLEPDVLIELIDGDSTTLETIEEELDSLSDIDPSCSDEEAWRKGRPDTQEKASSDKLFIKWVDQKSGKIIYTPTHKAFSEEGKLPTDLRFDDGIKDKIKKRVKGLRNKR